MDETTQRRWAAQWKAAGPALAASEALLALAGPVERTDARWGDSGLVEQQRLFHATLLQLKDAPEAADRLLDQPVAAFSAFQAVRREAVFP